MAKVRLTGAARFVVPANKLLSSRAPAGHKYPLAIMELHKAVKSREFGMEYNGVYLQLITLYQESNYIHEAVISGANPAEALPIEIALNHFLSINQAFDEKTINLLPIASNKMKENLPFVNFYAGLFSLARGNQEEALSRFLAADEFEAFSLKGKDLAEAVTEEIAADLLKDVLPHIKAGISLTPGAPVPVRQPFARSDLTPRPKSASEDPTPPPPPLAAAKEPTVKDVEKAKRLTSEAEDLAARKDYINSLRCLFLAVDYNPDDKNAQTALKHVLGFFDRWFVPDNFMEKQAPYEELQLVKGLLEVKSDFVPGLILAAQYSIGLNEYSQALEYITDALAVAQEGKEKNYALYVAGLMCYRRKENAEAVHLLVQIDSQSDVFEKAALIIAENYEILEDGEKGLAFIETHGGQLAQYQEYYFRAVFLLFMKRSPADLQKADGYIDRAMGAYQRHNPGRSIPSRFHHLRDRIGATDLEVRQALAREKEAEEAAARQLQEEAAAAAAVVEEVATEEVEEEVAIEEVEAAAAEVVEEDEPLVDPIIPLGGGVGLAVELAVEPALVETAGDHDGLSSRERDLHALQGAVRSRQEELDRREAEFETRRREAVELLDKRFEELRDWQTRLLAVQAEVQAAEGPTPRRQVIEVGNPSRMVKRKAGLFDLILRAMLSNDWSKVIGVLERILEQERDDAFEELLVRVRLIANKEVVEKDEALGPLQQQLDQATAELKAIKEERAELNKRIRELERQLQEARLANEQLKERLAQLAGGGASGQPKTFLEAWMWLSSKTVSELNLINPAFEGLFQAAEGKGRGAALTPAMIIERRRDIIKALIDAHLNKEAKISSYILQTIDSQLFSWSMSRRVVPGSFATMRNWVEAIIVFMKGQS